MEQEVGRFQTEIILFVILAACVILMASNFGAGGFVGDAIKNQNPSFNVSFQEINLEYETEYKVGCKIKHFLFGKGEIIDLIPTTNCNNDRCFSATIHFSNGDTKSIGLPMPREKFEIFLNP